MAPCRWLARAVSVAFLAAAPITEGLVFGGQRWAHLDQLAFDPGAFVLAAEAVLGLAVPWLLLRRGERRAGYLAAAVLGIVVVLAIGPVIALVWALADRF